MSQSKLELHEAEAKRGKTYANVSRLLKVLLFWMAKWSELFDPIALRSRAKPKQMRIVFDTQMITDLYWLEKPNIPITSSILASRKRKFHNDDVTVQKSTWSL